MPRFASAKIHVYTREKGRKKNKSQYYLGQFNKEKVISDENRFSGDEEESKKKKIKQVRRRNCKEQ